MLRNRCPDPFLGRFGRVGVTDDDVVVAVVVVAVGVADGRSLCYGFYQELRLRHVV